MRVIDNSDVGSYVEDGDKTIVFSKGQMIIMMIGGNDDEMVMVVAAADNDEKDDNADKMFIFWIYILTILRAIL